MTKNTGQLKTAIASGDIVVAPGIYDMISALVADKMAFPALYVTGYGTVASYLGLPDAGLATYTDMIHRISTFASMTKTPIIADADTGYGGLLNVAHTVKGYEQAGVSAIQLEDQEFPKKCGHTPNRRVIPMADMVRSGLGLDEALSRAEAYSRAGADILFVESPESEEEMIKICKTLDKPILANMVSGGRTPVLPAERLKEMGFSVVIQPTAGFLATAAALTKSYGELKEKGTITEKTDLYPFSEFNQLIGFPEVWAFDKRYAE